MRIDCFVTFFMSGAEVGSIPHIPCLGLLGAIWIGVVVGSTPIRSMALSVMYRAGKWTRAQW